jgi:hypothetical protein
MSNNLQKTEPVVKVGGVSATPLKHTSPVPVGLNRLNPTTSGKAMHQLQSPLTNLPNSGLSAKIKIDDPLTGVLYAQHQESTSSKTRPSMIQQVNSPPAPPSIKETKERILTPPSNLNASRGSSAQGSKSKQDGSLNIQDKSNTDTTNAVSPSVRVREAEARSTQEFLSKCAVPPLDLNNVEKSISGMQTLAAHNAWREVLQLSDYLYKKEPEGAAGEAYQDIASTGELTEFKSLRCEALFRCKEFDTLCEEVICAIKTEKRRLKKVMTNHSENISAIVQHGLLNVHLIQESQLAASESKIETLSQSDVPLLSSSLIAFRLLLAEVYVNIGRGDESLKKMSILYDELKDLYCLIRKYNIRSCEKQGIPHTTNGQEYSKQLFTIYKWQWSIRHSMVNVCVKIRQLPLVLKHYLAMLMDIQCMRRDEEGLCADGYSHGGPISPDNAGQVAIDKESVKEYNLSISKAIIVVLCRLSRSLLQNSALRASIAYCDKAIEALQENDLSDSDDIVTYLVRLTRALALYGMNEFQDAMNIFDDVILKATSSDTSQEVVESSSEALHKREGEVVWPLDFLVKVDPNLTAMAVNDYAVCALHMKGVSSSMDKLETLIQSNPGKHMTDPVVFNLCTLYELTCSTEESRNKKMTLRNVAQKYHLQDPVLNEKSYRL